MTHTNTFKYNEFLEVSGFRNNWNIVVESWEKDIVIKRVITWLFPFLPSTGVLSASYEDHISDLNEYTDGFKIFDLASIVQVNQDNLGSIEIDAVDKAILIILVLASVVISNTSNSSGSMSASEVATIITLALD